MGEDGLNSNIQKGPVQRLVDNVLNANDGGTFYRRDEVLQALEDTSRSYSQILETLFQVKDPLLTYIRSRWFPDTADLANTPYKVWWQDKQPIEPIIRQSLIKALELASPDLPIDSYWIAVGSPQTAPRDSYPFEVALTKSSCQVTRLILTPPAPPQVIPPNANTFAADVWIVKSPQKGVSNWETEEAKDAYQRWMITRLRERSSSGAPWSRMA